MLLFVGMCMYVCLYIVLHLLFFIFPLLTHGKHVVHMDLTHSFKQILDPHYTKNIKGDSVKIHE